MATRQSDRQVTRRQLQRLAIAAGVRLKDGSAVVIDGPGCPSVARIKAAIGFGARRMTAAQYSDMRDDGGATRPYFAATHEADDTVEAILREWSGETDCDGEMSLRDYLQICS